MKHNTWVKNIIYILLIVILFLVGTGLLSKLQETAQQTYTVDINLITLICIIFFGGIGIILGFDNFIYQLQLKGNWRIDIAKLVILGIPSFIVSIPYVIYMISPSMLSYSYIPSIVLGYTVISCIYKDIKIKE